MSKFCGWMFTKLLSVQNMLIVARSLRIGGKLTCFTTPLELVVRLTLDNVIASFETALRSRKKSLNPHSHDRFAEQNRCISVLYIRILLKNKWKIDSIQLLNTNPENRIHRRHLHGTPPSFSAYTFLRTSRSNLIFSSSA